MSSFLFPKQPFLKTVVAKKKCLFKKGQVLKSNREKI